MKAAPHPAAVAVLFALCAGAAVADPPALPEASGTVSIPAQEWPFQPGPREITVHIRYPGAGRTLADIGPRTGLMLSLHNWGGTGFAGTADPGVLAARYDVVAIGVDYLQSGKEASIEDPEPYDFGYLQALDALRALHFVWDGLRQRGIAIDDGRIFTTGGSGGGNVSLMANKLAPRTFAGVIDLCGMKRLSDDIAYGLPGGSSLNARYSREPGHPHFLSPGRQELHFLGHPGHLAVMKALGASARIVSVHGAEDATCPAADADAFAAAVGEAGLEIDYVRVTADQLDGKVFTSAGHPLGNRTEIVHRVAGSWLDPASPQTRRREGPTDFERREAVRYPVTGGTWVIDFAKGYPVGRFEAAR
ncbi:MAG: DUF2920 family protein [Verrucomicrobiales bacterium]|nr:DUF2920 family protein [Verrucomicrobiales bacterium]